MPSSRTITPLCINFELHFENYKYHILLYNLKTVINTLMTYLGAFG